MLMNLQIFDAASGLARRAASQQAIAAKNLANISIEAEREHSRAMAVYQSSLKILRASIGRGR